MPALSALKVCLHRMQLVRHAAAVVSPTRNSLPVQLGCTRMLWPPGFGAALEVQLCPPAQSCARRVLFNEAARQRDTSPGARATPSTAPGPMERICRGHVGGHADPGMTMQ